MGQRIVLICTNFVYPNYLTPLSVNIEAFQLLLLKIPIAQQFSKHSPFGMVFPPLFVSVTLPRIDCSTQHNMNNCNFIGVEKVICDQQVFDNTICYMEFSQRFPLYITNSLKIQQNWWQPLQNAINYRQSSEMKNI